MPLRVRPVDPLQHSVPIVDKNGLPTPQFIRQWVLARTINITTGDLTVSLDDLDAQIAELQELTETLKSEIDALQSLQILAGTGLTGGGALTADRTLSLEDTAVTPGTYGSATHYPQITVDQQGRVTAISEIAK